MSMACFVLAILRPWMENTDVGSEPIAKCIEFLAPGPKKVIMMILSLCASANNWYFSQTFPNSVGNSREGLARERETNVCKIEAHNISSPVRHHSLPFSEYGRQRVRFKHNSDASPRANV